MTDLIEEISMDTLHYCLIGGMIYLFIAWAVLLLLPQGDEHKGFLCSISIVWPLTLVFFIHVLIDETIKAFKTETK